jgi:mannose-6-phosphate isomerase-like protein (cupin superfamily)
LAHRSSHWIPPVRLSERTPSQAHFSAERNRSARTASTAQTWDAQRIGQQPFRALSNPATGERIQFSAVAPESDEDVVRFDWRSAPGGAVPEHVHPRQQERFTIVSGEAHFTLEGGERAIGAGESIVVAAGVRHAEENRGSVEVVGVVELRPALNTRQMHEAFAGLAADGMANASGAPRSPLQLGATIWHFRRESRVTSPPIWMQNLMLAPLAALARLFRVRPHYPRWDSRTSGTG